MSYEPITVVDQNWRKTTKRGSSRNTDTLIFVTMRGFPFVLYVMLVCCVRYLYVSSILGGYPFNGPLSGTKYPTRAASPIQNVSTPKSSLPFSKHRSCALLCTVVRRFV